MLRPPFNLTLNQGARDGAGAIRCSSKIFHIFLCDSGLFSPAVCEENKNEQESCDGLRVKIPHWTCSRNFMLQRGLQCWDGEVWVNSLKVPWLAGSLKIFEFRSAQCLLWVVGNTACVLLLCQARLCIKPCVYDCHEHQLLDVFLSEPFTVIRKAFSFLNCF